METPEIEVSEFLLTALKGLRLSDDPSVGEVAARREVEERARLEKLRSSNLRKQKTQRLRKAA